MDGSSWKSFLEIGLKRGDRTNAAQDPTPPPDEQHGTGDSMDCIPAATCLPPLRVTLEWAVACSRMSREPGAVQALSAAVPGLPLRPALRLRLRAWRVARVPPKEQVQVRPLRSQQARAQVPERLRPAAAGAWKPEPEKRQDEEEEQQQEMGRRK